MGAQPVQYPALGIYNNQGTIIPIGYPETPPKKHDESSRKKLDDMISYEKARQES